MAYRELWWTVRESNSQLLLAKQRLSHLTNSPYWQIYQVIARLIFYLQVLKPVEYAVHHLAEKLFNRVNGSRNARSLAYYLSVHSQEEVEKGMHIHSRYHYKEPKVHNYLHFEDFNSPMEMPNYS